MKATGVDEPARRAGRRLVWFPYLKVNRLQRSLTMNPQCTRSALSWIGPMPGSHPVK